MPWTAALHCDIPLAFTVAGLQVTFTDVIVDGFDRPVTVTDAVPDFAVSWVLVAVTVTVAAEPAAVKTPLESTVPPLADHFTAEL